MRSGRIPVRLARAAVTICATAIVLLGAGRSPAQPTTGPTSRPTLWIVGDSTVHVSSPEVGWGDRIAPFFDTSRITIQNRAIAGRSSRSFQYEGHWDAILKLAKAGDFVLIQMGHNDGGPATDPKGRASLPGLGEETQDITNPGTGKPETLHTYGWYMRKYVTDSLAIKMTPIICSPVPHVPRDVVQAGDVEKSNFVVWSQQVAESQHIDFINLNKLITQHYVGMNHDQIKAAFYTTADDTHFNNAGAVQNAGCVVDGIRSLPGCKLAGYLKPSPATAPSTQPTRPN